MNKKLFFLFFLYTCLGDKFLTQKNFPAKEEKDAKEEKNCQRRPVQGFHLRISENKKKSFAKNKALKIDLKVYL
jgi:hypothetical protein